MYNIYPISIDVNVVLFLWFVQGSKEESMLLLRNFYRGDELFLDMFDDEYQSMAVSMAVVQTTWFLPYKSM